MSHKKKEICEWWNHHKKFEDDDDELENGGMGEASMDLNRAYRKRFGKEKK